MLSNGHYVHFLQDLLLTGFYHKRCYGDATYGNDLVDLNRSYFSFAKLMNFIGNIFLLKKFLFCQHLFCFMLSETTNSSKWSLYSLRFVCVCLLFSNFMHYFSFYTSRFNFYKIHEIEICFSRLLKTFELIICVE